MRFPVKNLGRLSLRSTLGSLAAVLCVAACGAVSGASVAASVPGVIAPHPIGELTPIATLRLGKTADWVAIAPDAVWVGSTGPFAVHKIDPKTNKQLAVVKLDGEPCAGLTIGFDSLWIPLCGPHPTLARVNLTTARLTTVLRIGPAAAEGGVTASRDSVWLIIDKRGSLARIDPETGAVRQIVHVPPGSYNPLYDDSRIWVTRAGGAEITSIDAATGRLQATVRTGPGPRFLTAGAGAIWTLNQGDGTLTRIDTLTNRTTRSIELGTPGRGGDISFGAGMVWTTVWKIPLSLIDGGSGTLRCQWAGPGGDSLGIGHGSIWLTDYHAGTISRIALDDALAHCADSSM